MQNDESSHVLFTELLEVRDMFEWPSKLPAPQLSTSSPLEAFWVLLDFYMEVHEAADLYGQCMVAGMDKLLDPTVHKPPMTLSNNEHTRFACGLWVLKIFHQVRSKLNNSPWLFNRHCAYAFVQNLRPWQINQVLTLEEKIDCAEHPSLSYVGPTDLGIFELLVDTKYVRKLFAEWHARTRRPFGNFHSFSDAVDEFQLQRWNHRAALVDTEHLSMPPSVATQLQGHTWGPSKSGLNASVINTEAWQWICRAQGLFFWDYFRLAHWQIVDVDELIAASKSARQQDLSSQSTQNYSTLRSRRPSASARTMERQIIEWTRSSDASALERCIKRP
ncbi:hypothetical protein OPT61_g2650 [Boeremia exigua]|uniref:Uncharacterized protein n=1 Tax=Boeremia exigua TaxID=749465 RepID=A0ACC2IL27_9PLEO|nr:hypothetical protein OPT61_g2650 [Boeremia exigua]